MRRAEQRCPAEPNADRITSSITCSRWAVVSTNMPFSPPVSATRGMIGPGRSARSPLMRRAVSTPPVKATPSQPGWRTRRSPTAAPSPHSRASRRESRPAAWTKRTASQAISGVCSAGLASTALPAARAAATWPRKIDRGKFQGLMQTRTPRPCSSSVLRSPAGPRSNSGPAKRSRASLA